MQPTKRVPDSDWAARTVDTALAVFQSCRKYQTMLSGRPFESDLQSEIATQLSRNLGQLWLAATSAHYLEPVAKPTSVEAWPDDFVIAWNGLRSWTIEAIEQLHFQPIAENLMMVIRLGEESKEIESGGTVKRWYRTGEYTWPTLTDTDVRPLAFVIKELRRTIDADLLTPSPLEVKRQVFLNAEKLGFTTVRFSQDAPDTKSHRYTIDIVEKTWIVERTTIYRARKRTTDPFPAPIPHTSPIQFDGNAVELWFAHNTKYPRRKKKD